MKTKLTFFASVLAVVFATSCDRKEDLPEPTPTFSATKVLNLNPDFITIEGLEQGRTFEAGDRVSLTIKPGEVIFGGFQPYHIEHIHIHVGNSVLFPEYPAGVEADAQELKLDFEVPQEDFELVATYSIQQQFSEDGHTMTLEENKDGVKLYGVAPQEKYKYFNCALLVPEAYTISKVEFNIGGEWQDASQVTGCGFERSEVIDNVYLVSVRPDFQNVTGDVRLRVSGEQHRRGTITWKSTIAGAIDDPRNELPVSAIDGESVTGAIWFADDVYLAGASASTEIADIKTVAGAYVTFTMPAEDVTITVDVRKKITVSYVPSAHFADAVFYTDPDTYYGVPTTLAQPGGKIYLLAEVTGDYKPVNAVTARGVKSAFSSYEPGKYFAEISVPADAAELSVSIEDAKGYNVIASNEIQFDGGTFYVPGETVGMAIYVPAGKRITSVTVRDAKGVPVQTNDDFPYSSFIMPASDVTVTVTYEDTQDSDQVNVIAYFDEEQYSVRSSTNYDWDFAEGFTMTNGGTFYLTVEDQYGENFYVGVKIGGILTVYAAELDDMGEYSFGKALVANGNVEIKVGATRESVTF